MQVTKRDGSKEELNLDKIHIMVERACDGIAGVSASQVEMNSGIQFYDGITTKNIQSILIKSAVDLISLETPNYQYVAARLLSTSLRKQVWGSEIPPKLLHIVELNIESGVYDKEIITYYTQEEWEHIESFIKHERDDKFTHAGLQQVVDKYLVQNRLTREVYETPQFMYIMIAATLFSSYPKDTRLSYIKRYYDAISKFKISLPTPIMAGVRTPLRQYSSCVLVSIDDTLDSIYSSNHAIGKYVSQRAGIGINSGRIRAFDSPVRGGDVKHTGAIPFLRMLQATTKSCTQNGIRGGASTNFFPWWHKDVEQFIVLKNNQGSEDTRVREMDHCIQFNKLFYQRYLENKSVSLFCPNDVPGLYEAFATGDFDSLYEKYEKDKSVSRVTIKARDLLHEVAKERFETGRIYIMNIDHANTHSHSKKPIYMSNLCVAPETLLLIRDKQTNLPSEVQISILENQAVEAWNGEEWSEVVVKKTSEGSLLLRVELQDLNSNIYSLDCTEYHKFYILDDSGEVKAVPIGKLVGSSGIKLESFEMPMYSGGGLYRRRRDLTITGVYRLDPKPHPTYCAYEGKRNRLTFNGIVTGNCTEITLPTVPIQHIDDENGRIATCILSAINLGTTKPEEYENLCDLAVRALDALIDYQGYPVKAAELYTKEQRTLGIGVINFAYFLAKNKVAWDSEEAYTLTHDTFEALQYYMLKASNNLAQEVGKCPAFDTTKYADGVFPIDSYKKDVDDIVKVKCKQDWASLKKDVGKYGLRNACVSAIMPAESSAVVSNSTNGIEPPRDYISVKKSKQGALKQVVPEYQKLKNYYELLWSMQSPVPYLKHVALMQKFIDQSISTNTSYNPEFYENNSVPLSVLVKDILLAYKLGIKTLYYNNTNDLNSDSVEQGCESGACAI